MSQAAAQAPVPGKPRRRKRPPQWRQINFPSRGVLRMGRTAARKPIRQRARDLWERFRLLIRSATVWAVFSVYYFATGSIAAGIGLAFVSLIFLLFRPHLKELELRLEYDFGTDSAEFLSTLAGATGVPIVAGNAVTLYHRGLEFYPAMLLEISKAKYSITMEQYIFAESCIGWEFAKALAERAEAGVQVKLLLDAVGSAGVSGRMVAMLQQAGCELAWFHPIRWYNLHRINNRTHRKSLIIDGHVAFTGGAGVADHWRDETGREWRDMQIRIEGPAVAPLQTGFSTNWLETTGEVIAGPAYYPVFKPHGGSVDVQTILSSPKGDLYTASILYSLAIQCARQTILIANPYFIPGPRAVDMFADAVDRGVQVKVLVAGDRSDTWWARSNSIALYGDLLRAGVELYEYEPTMLHQKVMLVDSIWATVGTANFDNRSFAFNEEANVCFYDPDLVEQIRTQFLTDLSQSTRITMDAWQKRGWRRRAGERISWLLRDQV